MKFQEADYVIANPQGYDLSPAITKGIPVLHNQEEALKDADFVYAKNWCSYSQYGQILSTNNAWCLTEEKDGTDQQREVYALLAGATKYRGNRWGH